MIIRFNKVTPLPLDGVTHLTTQIWDRDISFDSQKRYEIDAASGKGKSTFVNLIYGLRQDYSGDIFIDSNNIKKIKNNDWAEVRQKQFSIIFQDLRLFPELTALENVHLKYSLNEYIPLEKIEAYFEKLKISPIANKQAKLLSYGERQRVAIIRAMVQPFSLLLMDEPFSHLDEDNAKNAAEIIATECNNRNAGFIVTSLGGVSYFQVDETLLI